MFIDMNMFIYDKSRKTQPKQNVHKPIRPKSNKFRYFKKNYELNLLFYSCTHLDRISLFSNDITSDILLKFYKLFR